jgi:hypothetical protein
MQTARAGQHICASGAELPSTHPAGHLSAMADAVAGSGSVKAIFEPGRIRLEKYTGMAAAQSVQVPLSSYRGITLALGAQSVLTLLHEVEDFCVTLAVYDPLHDNDEDILSEGQRWAENLGCDLLLEDGEDRKSMPLAVTRPRPRRANSFFAARRPRFLTRRSTGATGAAHACMAQDKTAQR